MDQGKVSSVNKNGVHHSCMDCPKTKMTFCWKVDRSDWPLLMDSENKVLMRSCISSCT